MTRRRGDTALSGTLVQEGRIRIYAERVGRHAAAARIADFVEHSLEAKSNTQLEAAKLADRLVPMVLGLSGGTWVVSQDTDDSQYTSEDLINMAASVEEHYFHPMAMAVVEAAERLPHQQHFNHKEVEFIVAHGVASSIEGRRIVVGSRHFLEEHEGIDMEPFSAVIERLRNDGKTLLYIGYGSELLGVLALKDTLRSNAAATVQRLRQLGVGRVIMLTGDQPERARLMAEHLGLDDYRAGLMPEDKALALKNLAGEGARIAFVGDGINDAPALSGAHVGMAMHHGADVARLAADITLLEDDIARVADAKALALATRGLVDSNFKLTVGLNTGILSAAAFGLLNPVAASALHNGSTIGILLRALAGAGLPRGQAARAA
ncbi:HAD-IC family P-type ATPase [Ectothiorhodospira sp. 9100]|uniref:HAD-IC family P-type ATPase n=1 Tax=unclassified Ectothiorhodospira TaxID=2684909 RepID=UPI001EE7FC2F|nr:HAD-IC family P-type ATPase [Ectothiorhodospira sp. 9100]MCG5520320.1 HAD-IC family P-type ATPase [Ectothiorhodospira sp. 9905]